MQEYVKIYNIFNRDETGSLEIKDGYYMLDTVQMLKDIHWCWTEKVDGTNVRIYWNGHSLSFGAKYDTDEISSDVKDYLTTLFINNEFDEMFEQKFGRSCVTLFGVCYKTDINDIKFVLHDVYKDDIWLSQVEIDYIAHCFNIDSVPVVSIGVLKRAIDFVKTKPMSKIGDFPMSGLICKPCIDLFDRLGNRIMVKIRVRDF